MSMAKRNGLTPKRSPGYVPDSNAPVVDNYVKVKKLNSQKIVYKNKSRLKFKVREFIVRREF